MLHTPDDELARAYEATPDSSSRIDAQLSCTAPAAAVTHAASGSGAESASSRVSLFVCGSASPASASSLRALPAAVSSAASSGADAQFSQGTSATPAHAPADAVARTRPSATCPARGSVVSTRTPFDEATVPREKFPSTLCWQRLSTALAPSQTLSTSAAAAPPARGRTVAVANTRYEPLFSGGGGAISSV